MTKHFGCVRLVYNLALEAKTAAWTSRRISLFRFDLSVQLKELKQTCDWLKEVNSQSLQAALLHLESAYRNFFDKTSRFPRFKTGEEMPQKRPIDKRRAVGIDVGLQTFAVLSTGATIDNPRHLRGLLERLKVLQRRASRRKRGSANRKRRCGA